MTRRTIRSCQKPYVHWRERESERAVFRARLRANERTVPQTNQRIDRPTTRQPGRQAVSYGPCENGPRSSSARTWPIRCRQKEIAPPYVRPTPSRYDLIDFRLPIRQMVSACSTSKRLCAVGRRRLISKAGSDLRDCAWPFSLNIVWSNSCVQNSPLSLSAHHHLVR